MTPASIRKPGSGFSAREPEEAEQGYLLEGWANSYHFPADDEEGRRRGRRGREGNPVGRSLVPKAEQEKK